MMQSLARRTLRPSLFSCSAGIGSSATLRSSSVTRGVCLPSEATRNQHTVAFIGSGNWGSAAAWLAAQNAIKHDEFNDTIRMYVHEETIGGADDAEISEAWKVVSPHLVNGEMDATALQLLGAEVGVSISRAESVAALSEMDADSSGYVSRNEFFKWWKHSGKSNMGRLLTSVINRQRENVKYLPGIKLGDNVKACPSLEETCRGADLLVFVTPHQFIQETCELMKAGDMVKPGAKAVSLIKGMEINRDGFNLISGVIQREIPNIDGCSVLMGANVASEIAEGNFAEATIGAYDESHSKVFEKLFHTGSFHVRTSMDVAAVEMCGTLKNIVALAAGFIDGLGYGNNAKAAIMRVGFGEMKNLIGKTFPNTNDQTYWESCGMADLITTCYGGRNRKCAEAFVNGKGRQTFGDIEEELLGGQKLQGTLTSDEVQELLIAKGWEKEFPLFTTVNRIAQGDLPPSAIVHYDEEGIGIGEIEGRRKKFTQAQLAAYKEGKLTQLGKY